MSFSDSILSKTIMQGIEGIISKDTKLSRNTLDARVTILNIRHAALKISAPRLSLKQYLLLIEHIGATIPIVPIGGTDMLDEYVADIIDKKTAGKSIRTTLYYCSPELAVVIGGSYASVQTNISKALKSFKGTSGISTSIFTSTNRNGTIESNIGHMTSPEFESTISPLEDSINTLVTEIGNYIDVTNPVFTGTIERAIKKLQVAHKKVINSEIKFLRDNYSPTSPVLGNLVVYTTLQSFSVNNSLSKSELAASTYLKSELRKLISRPDILEKLVLTKGSNNILEDIAEGLLSSITGKKLSANTKHKEKSSSSRTKVDSNFSNAIKNPTKAPPTSKNVVKPKVESYSLASLQTLINTHLQDVISANMGDGTQRKVLNYRTGRFAASAKVERLSQSREGMITAFYSYMKNPYATFSEGGRQSIPSSRDPKLLISKSIREIAQTKVANRLRAVVV